MKKSGDKFFVPAVSLVEDSAAIQGTGHLRVPVRRLGGEWRLGGEFKYKRKYKSIQMCACAFTFTCA